MFDSRRLQTAFYFLFNFFLFLIDSLIGFYILLSSLQFLRGVGLVGLVSVAEGLGKYRIFLPAESSEYRCSEHFQAIRIFDETNTNHLIARQSRTENGMAFLFGALLSRFQSSLAGIRTSRGTAISIDGC